MLRSNQRVFQWVGVAIFMAMVPQIASASICRDLLSSMQESFYQQAYGDSWRDWVRIRLRRSEGGRLTSNQFETYGLTRVLDVNNVDGDLELISNFQVGSVITEVGAIQKLIVELSKDYGVRFSHQQHPKDHMGFRFFSIGTLRFHIQQDFLEFPSYLLTQLKAVKRILKLRAELFAMGVSIANDWTLRPLHSQEGLSWLLTQLKSQLGYTVSLDPAYFHFMKNEDAFLSTISGSNSFRYLMMTQIGSDELIDEAARRFVFKESFDGLDMPKEPTGLIHVNPLYFGSSRILHKEIFRMAENLGLVL